MPGGSQVSCLGVLKFHAWGFSSFMPGGSQVSCLGGSQVSCDLNNTSYMIINLVQSVHANPMGVNRPQKGVKINNHQRLQVPKINKSS